MNTARAIIVALLTPFWWGIGLLVLALSSDLWRAARPHVAGLLERLEGTRPTSAAVSDRRAA